MSRRRMAMGLAALLLAVPAGGILGQSNIEVSGMGLLENNRLDRRLAFLGGYQEPEEARLNPAGVDDAAFVLLQLLQRAGYPEPAVEGRLAYTGGEAHTVTWRLPFEPADFPDAPEGRLQSVQLHCLPGQQAWYRNVEVLGVDIFTTKTLENFFLPEGALFTLRSDKAFTRTSLDQRSGRLIAALQANGYQDARVLERSVERQPDTGAVDVRLVVEQGGLHQVRSAFLEVPAGNPVTEGGPLEVAGETLMTREWERDTGMELLNRFYAAGFPEARLRVHRAAGSRQADGTVPVDVTFHIDPGQRFRLDEVHFQPDNLVKDPVLRRQVDLGESEWFDLIAVNEGRRRLLRLGVFENVEWQAGSTDSPGTRSLTYQLDPLARSSLNLRAGWGSYEMGRAAVLWRQRNMWGRGHQYEAEIRRSFKSFNADLTYTVPHFFDHRVSAFVRGGHSFREEIGFDRESDELVLGVSRRFEQPGIDTFLEYRYENLDTTRRSRSTFDSEDQAHVTSILLDLNFDRRDNPLNPSAGFDAGLTLKVASEILGGEADYTRMELSTSFHHYLGTGLYLHASLAYGTALSESPSQRNLPFNERFFPGGENSVRGYQRGEASPLSPDGDPIGAETIALANLEIEQRLLRSFSVVLFWDGLGTSLQQTPVPDEAFLQSVGLGLRWRTPVGPIRLEYGHNLDPRPADPDGTLHFAVGYPF